MILISKFFIPKGFQGLTLYPFVILKYATLKSNRELINHERIHLKQQLELLIFPFYVLYGIEFLVRLVQYKNGHKAYRNISFEREAYINEKDLNYLESRSWFSFFKYYKL
ncbi:hypothetical protein [Formosa algae]|uniref:DUF4157 domain-containing protein n=1 Tax=Formosa algae TaxID=225843 RepID=A0A9X0YGM2_9FLAO|nr:hypothetical protein [Formosa algae]MBP1838125.1 hypothetical protein [Formosa algae]MDQ0334260.1 hypothetical protein [Formosa algae]OEI80092.1 hypothetical protein AST99_11090 [Formosa algae]PNW29842.1 hypothetical protein BKP44_01575 [Formosa algae]